MKRFQYILFAILSVSLAGCKDYLTAPEPGVTRLEDYYTSGQACVYNVNGCYVPLMWEFSSTYCSEWFIGDVMSDDALKGGQNTNDMAAAFDLENWRTVSNNEIAYDVWRANFYGIARCNMAIHYIPDVATDSTMSASMKQRLIGEAKFLRAFYYFRLVRIFGGVPLTLDVISDDAEWTMPRASVEQIFTAIINDLKDAEAGLWNKSEYPATELGRATKGAAQAMLMKTYLYMASPYWNKQLSVSADECYAQAKYWGEQLIAAAEAGEYSLCPNYADNFTLEGENGQESIFEIQYVEDPTSDYGGNEGGFGATRGTFTIVLTRSRSSKIGGEGWGFNKPTNNLYQEYEPTDPRRDATILNPVDSLVENPNEEFYLGTRYLSRKYALYTNETGTEFYKLAHATRGPINNKQIRLADAYLMYAEACLGAGDEATAKTYINKVRERVGLGEVGTYSITVNGQTIANPTVEQCLRHERRVELAMEGHRWFDLVRYGGTKAHMDAYAATETTEAKAQMNAFIEGVHELLPIPSKERQLNTALTQNHGY